jgi:hypothetical protein
MLFASVLLIREIREIRGLASSSLSRPQPTHFVNLNPIPERVVHKKPPPRHRPPLFNRDTTRF